MSLAASAVERFAREHYGIECRAEPLPGEKDLNFRLRTSGAEYVFKAANVSTPREEIEFQILAMEHAGRSALPVAIPRTIAARDGCNISEIETPQGRRFVHILTFLPGIPWADYRPRTGDLLRELGRAVGSLDAALGNFQHPLAQRSLKWDLAGAGWIREHLFRISDSWRRAMVTRHLERYEGLAPELAGLRKQVIYNDANDHNILVSPGGQIAGLIDFGDAIESPPVCDAAITCAYAAMEQDDPIGAACCVVRGFHEAFPLEKREIGLLFPLIAARLCVTVVNAAWQEELEPANAYLQISARAAWNLLEALDAVQPSLAHYRFRAACGLPAVPHAPRIGSWLRDHQSGFASLIEPDLKTCPKIRADWSTASTELANPDAYLNPARMAAQIQARMAEAGAEVAIGGYNVARLCPSGGEDPPRTVHTGLDLFLPAGSPVFAPMDGVVHSFRNNAERYDYGPAIVLEHRAGDVPFWTLYGHLSVDSLDGLERGQAIRRGVKLGTLGDWTVNGGWPPHLHFQIVTDMLGHEGSFPGACQPTQRDVWLSLSPDPNLVAQIPAEFWKRPAMEDREILERRRESIGYNLSISYRRNLHIVRGYKQWLYDAEGWPYLDCVNNVAHVGHCHPRVVEAGQKQMAVLNTNTRYLHELLVRYAERLTAKFPEPLRVCFFVNSGSEANELALRLARAHTGRKDMVVVDVAYHGNTTGAIDLSPYKFDHRGGSGAPDWVHKTAIPDRYRGEAGVRYAAQVGEAIDGRAIAGFICEGILSCGGQIVLPPGYLAEAYRMTRAAGGVCIADEVQTGFGRVGSHFWAFETQGVVPDIVTLGKPIGNGHPLGAVVTTPEIAASFNNGLEYFNTFGGNAVSCAIGLAVLDVMADERLQENALRTGAQLMDGLRDLMERHALIGDVRGLGLFCGFELVRDRETLEPAAEEASYLVNRMREQRILLSTDGPFENVIKIKPPLCFNSADVDRVLHALDGVLRENPLRITASRR